MSRRTRSQRKTKLQQQREEAHRKYKTVLKEVIDWFIPPGELFAESAFHGKVKWQPE